MHKKAIEIKERILGSEVCPTGSWCDRYVPIHYRPDQERLSDSAKIFRLNLPRLVKSLLNFCFL